MDAWHDFAVLTGGTLGVLIGLLFVGLSVRASTINLQLSLRYRIAQVLVLFLGLLCANAVVVMPVYIRVAGIAVVVIANLMGWALVHLDHESKRSPGRPDLERLLNRINPNVVTYSLLMGTGVAWIFEQQWGGFLLALAVLFGTVGGLAAAWFLLLSPIGPDSADATSSSD